MALQETLGPAPRRRPRLHVYPREVWPEVVLMLAAAIGLFAAMHAYFDRSSGIQGEPGTLLVIIACALILFGLAVTAATDAGTVRRVFQWLIIVGAVLTALAAWFLMSWVLMVAMIVAAVAQIVRMARTR